MSVGLAIIGATVNSVLFVLWKHYGDAPDEWITLSRLTVPKKKLNMHVFLWADFWFLWLLFFLAFYSF